MSEQSQKYSIVIVDDAPENLDILKNVLRDAYMVKPVTNGRLALRLANMEPQPDLILLDVMMPDMDGYEVCRLLKSNPKTAAIPIIFVTAKNNPDDELKGLQIGAADYITKPISPAIVKARVGTQLALAQANQEMQNKNRRVTEINERLSESMEQLAASEERFRSLVQTIPDIVYKIDEEGRFNFLNKSIERLGYHQSELIGHHFTELIHSADIHEASLSEVINRIGKGTANPEQKVFDERRSGDRMTSGLEIRLRAKSGSASEVSEIRNISHNMVSVEVNSTGLYGEDSTNSTIKQYIGTVGVIRDVSDRLTAQKALDDERKLLRELINTVPMPIFFATQKNRLVFTNQALQNFVPHELKSVEGTPLEDLFDPKEASRITGLISLLFDDPNCQQINREITLTAHTGKTHTVQTIVSKFYRIDEDTPSVIGILVDVTDQKAFENALIAAQAKAEQMSVLAQDANRAKGDFLANMSHEIRTPMNAIIGLSHLCLQTELDTKQHDYLNKVHTSANALLRLLNDILDFSKIEAGNLTLEQAPFSLNDLFTNLGSVIGIKSQEKGIEFLIDTPPDLPTLLIGDGFRLGQILTNLAGNAVKFTDAGAVSIHTEKVEQQNTNLVLKFTVSDSGIGMSSDQMDHLFDKFTQADASISRKYGGTGLGLAISKQLVELMGGTIWAESTPDVGSKFIFTTRLTVENQQKKELPYPSFKGKTALVVDDNNLAREVNVNLLKQLDFTIEAAENGPTAIQKIIIAVMEGRTYDLILLDWNMPEMDGLELAHRIRNDLTLERTPAIIMVTSHPIEKISALDEPVSLFDTLLEKPLNTATLCRSICHLFGMETSACDDQITDSAPKEVPDNQSALSKSHILVADDNDINQIIVKELLEKVGVRVSCVNNGEEALNLASKESFDAVLMDLKMPIMDGLTATREIRRQLGNNPLPIIAMTAKVMSDDRNDCLQAGMNDYVDKPIEPETLYRVLAEWLNAPLDRIISDSTQADQTEEHSVIALPELPGIDVKAGLRNVGGDVEFYKKIIMRFVQNQAATGQQLYAYLKDKEFDSLRKLAHTLKGVSGSVGAHSLREKALEIEQLSKSDMPSNTLDLLIESTIQVLDSTLKTISAAFPDALNQQTESTQQENAQTDDLVQLAELLNKADELLQLFDVSVEQTIEKLDMIVHSSARKERIISLRKKVREYDFEACSTEIEDWQKAEGFV
ncbi:MAG: response regulator [Magnetococcales bacterium]|nr:response regulator [Magnetococcales bacterium]